MSDLVQVLPDFPIGQFGGLLPALERHGVSISDLLTLDAAEVGRRTGLPLLDIRRLAGAVLDTLHADLGVSDRPAGARGGVAGQQQQPPQQPPPPPPLLLRHGPADLAARWATISTLDADLDGALGGGIPAGCITEITGESGAGKTQFLLSLLLAVQLPPPHGLGRPALYISTEASLPTRRLAQMLATNPIFRSASPPPTLDGIISTTTRDLESQDHILTFQVPVEIARRNVGLLVLDSVAANFRAEFDRGRQQSSNMGARSAELVRLGMQLRDLATRHNLAVVVANQVADRFTSPLTLRSAGRWTSSSTQESPLAARSRAKIPITAELSSSAHGPPSSIPDERPPPPPVLSGRSRRRSCQPRAAAAAAGLAAGPPAALVYGLGRRPAGLGRRPQDPKPGAGMVDAGGDAHRPPEEARVRAVAVPGWRGRRGWIDDAAHLETVDEGRVRAARGGVGAGPGRSGRVRCDKWWVEGRNQGSITRTYLYPEFRRGRRKDNQKIQRRYRVHIRLWQQ